MQNRFPASAMTIFSEPSKYQLKYISDIKYKGSSTSIYEGQAKKRHFKATLKNF